MLGWSAALAVAAGLAAVLAPISVDQPIDGRQMLGWGLRWGGLMAVAMASGAALADPVPASGGRSARVVAITALSVLLLSLLAGALAVVAVRLGLWGHDWGLPSRSGYAARLATLQAAELLGPPAAGAGGWALFRQRRSPPGERGHG
jgi:hypothetical protein